MKKTALIFCLVVIFPFMAKAQNPQNSNPDSILGTYLVPEKGNDSKVEFTKNSDGTFDCTIVWMESMTDPSTGKPWLDFRNPDKNLRKEPCLGLKIIKGLKYNPEKQCWDGTKVYDPNRGIKANATVKFDSEGVLCVTGKVLGIGETARWPRTRL